MRKRNGWSMRSGYAGDCCDASFELSFASVDRVPAVVVALA
jgi:hypothetical protein